MPIIGRKNKLHYTMKTISLEEAFEILENATAVIIDDNPVIYPGLADLNGIDENEFLYLSWEDGEDYCLKFAEGDNREVDWDGKSIFLYDTDAHDSEKTKITILN